MTNIEWLDELPAAPARKRPAPKAAWVAVANALRENPGKWAKVESYGKKPTATGVASKIRKGENLAFEPAGAFEAAVRPDGDVFDLYVRFAFADSSEPNAEQDDTIGDEVIGDSFGGAR